MRRIIIPALLAAVLGAGEAPARHPAPAKIPGDARVTTAAAGDYQAAYLVLQGWGKADKAKEDIPVFVALRDGKGVAGLWPLNMTRTDVGGVTLAGDALRGVLRDRQAGHAPGTNYTYTLACTVKDGVVTGTWTGSWWGYVVSKPVQAAGRMGTETTGGGSVTGRIVGREQLLRENALAPGASWTSWHGSRGDLRGTGPVGGLVEDLAQARLAWKGEDEMPGMSGKTGNLRPRFYGNVAHLPPTGGGATPLIAGDRVYITYYYPSGPVPAQMKEIYAQGFTAPHDNWDKFRIGADQVLACMDARTGALIWRTVWPDVGFNVQNHKGCPSNLTPAIDGDRIFVVTHGSTLLAADTKTGRELWRQRLAGADRLDAMYKEALATDTYGKGFKRDWGHSPLAVDGLVISSEFPDEQLSAFDAATGERRWTVQHQVSRRSSPLLWRGPGGPYLIVAGMKGGHLSGILCVKLADGAIAWSSGTDMYWDPHMNMACIDGDLIAFRDPRPPTQGVPYPADAKLAAPKPDAPAAAKPATGGDDDGDGDEGGGSEPPGSYVIARLKPGGIESVTTIADIRGLFTKWGTPVLADGRLHLTGRKITAIFDAATGAALSVDTGPGGGNGGFVQIAADRLLVNGDGMHGGNQLHWFSTAGGKLTRLSGPNGWVPRLPQTTSYCYTTKHPIVDGRLFLRGEDAIYCFDLRTGAAAR